MPLHPEDMYLLDGMAECLEITPEVYTAFRFEMVPGYSISDIAQNEGFFERGYDGEAFGQRLTEDFDAFYESLPMAGQAFFMMAFQVYLKQGLNLLERQVGTMVERAFEASQDWSYIKSPNYLENIVRSGLESTDHDLGYIPTLDDARHPANINRALDAPRLHHFVSRIETNYERAAELNQSGVDWNEAIQWGASQQLSSHTRLQEEGGARSKLSVSKKKKKSGRSIFKRSMRLFKSVLGHDNLKVFLDGGEMRVDGHYFDYRVKKSSVDLVDHSANPHRVHIPYTLEVTDKNTGVVLTDACVLFKGTPVLDQIVALSMYIKSGAEDEQELLQKMNMINRRPGFYDAFEQLPFKVKATESISSDPCNPRHYGEQLSPDDRSEWERRKQVLKEVQEQVGEALHKHLPDRTGLPAQWFEALPEKVHLDELIDQVVHDSRGAHKLLSKIPSLAEPEHFKHSTGATFEARALSL